MNTKTAKKTFTIQFKEEDSCNILAYQKFLKRHLKSGDKIPARVLNKFFSFFTLQEITLAIEIKKTITKIRQQTRVRYLNDKDYSFNKKLFISDKTFLAKTRFVCNLDNLIDSVFSEIDSKYSKSIDKRILIELIDEKINSYFSFFKVDSNKLLSRYKRDAIIGFIVHKLGFQLSKEIMDFGEDPPNNLLHQAIKYHTAKKKRARK